MMFEEKELRIIRAQITEAINRLEENKARVDIVNAYGYSKADYLYVDTKYLYALKDIRSKIDKKLVLEKEEEGQIAP